MRGSKKISLLEIGIPVIGLSDISFVAPRSSLWHLRPLGVIAMECQMTEAEVLMPIPNLSGVKVSKAELSEMIGVPVATLDQWVRSGAPHEKTGAKRSPLQFDTAQVIAWARLRHVLNNQGLTAARIARIIYERDALAGALERQQTAP